MQRTKVIVSYEYEICVDSLLSEQNYIFYISNPSLDNYRCTKSAALSSSITLFSIIIHNSIDNYRRTHFQVIWLVIWLVIHQHIYDLYEFTFFFSQFVSP
jgi:hypothetical protein